MENEENRGITHKTASKDKLANLLSVQVWSSLIILSLSLTLGHLEFSWSTLALDQRRKRRKRERKESKDQGKESRIKQLQQEHLWVIFCICDFLAGLEMHGFACWCMVFLFLVIRSCWVTKLVFSLAKPFFKAHGMLGCLFQF